MPSGESEAKETAVTVPETEWILQSTERETIFYGYNQPKSEKPIAKRIGDFLKKSCSLKNFKERLPLSKWLPKYSPLDFKGDLVAGITVGMTTVPQALAYAQIAELPLEVCQGSRPKQSCLPMIHKECDFWTTFHRNLSLIGNCNYFSTDRQSLWRPNERPEVAAVAIDRGEGGIAAKLSAFLC